MYRTNDVARGGFSLSSGLSVVAACVAVAAFFVSAPAVQAATNVNGPISTDTTWAVAGNPYIAENVTVNPGVTLTVEPGVVVKFLGSSSNLSVSGSLIVEGALENPVYFTSYKDDSPETGGDTNGDGTSTLPSAGNWSRITFASGANGNVAHVIIRYGGAGNGSSVLNQGGNVVISDSRITQSQQIGLQQSEATAQLVITGTEIDSQSKGIYATGGILNISASNIHNNAFGVILEDYYASPSATITSTIFSGASTTAIQFSTQTVNLTNSTFFNNAKNVQVGNFTSFTHSGNVATSGRRGYDVNTSIDVDTVIEQSDLPYIVNTLNITPGKTLTLSPGVIMKFIDTQTDWGFYGQLSVGGTLNINGTAQNPVYLTSLRDDSAETGGDTGGDGSSTLPAPIKWKGINFSGTVGNITHAVIRYAAVGISNLGGDVTISDSQIMSLSVQGTGIYQNYAGSQLSLTNTEVFGHSSGIEQNEGTLSIIDANIHGNFRGILSGNPAVTSTTISGSSFSANSDIAFAFGTQVVVLTDNVFTGNGKNVQVGGLANFTHSGNTVTGGMGGYDISYVLVDEDTTVGSSDLPYVIDELSVASGAILTLSPGVVMKFRDTFQNGAVMGALVVSGVLVVDGTPQNPVYLTSINDDSVGGDTNGDGASVPPTAMKWKGVNFETGSVGSISHAIIRYAGAGGYGSYGAGITNQGGNVIVSDSQVTSVGALGTGIYQSGQDSHISLTNTEISSHMRGVYVNGGEVTIDASNVFGNMKGIEMDGLTANDPDTYVTVNASTLSGNSYAAILFNGQRHHVTITDNVFAGNGMNVQVGNLNNFIHAGNTVTSGQGGYYLSSVTVNEDLTLSQSDLPYVINNLSVAAGKILTLSPGVIMKFVDTRPDWGQYGSFGVNGSLHVNGTVENPVYLTSLRDDSVGGDTNGDGSSTPVAAGKWKGVSFVGGSSANMSHVVIHYAANGILNQGGTVSISDSQVLSLAKQSSGIYQNVGGSYTTVVRTEISGNNQGIYVDAGTLDVSGASIRGNLYGVYITASADATIHDSFIAYNDYGLISYTSGLSDTENNWWGSASGPLHSTMNTMGTGNPVFGATDFTPWLNYNPLLTPVVFIPGIMGTYLAHSSGSQEEVWPNVQKMIDVLHPGDDYLDALKLKSNGYESLDGANADILPTQVIQQIGDNDFYNEIASTLGSEGYSEGFNYLPVAYDWRKANDGVHSEIWRIDNAITAARNISLNGKISVVTHSMGGLLLKGYLATQPDTSYLDNVVLVGTPNFGAPKAFKLLNNGDDMGLSRYLLGLNPGKAKEISQNMPSVYELLPSEKYLTKNTPSNPNYQGAYIVDHRGAGINGFDHNETAVFLGGQGRNPTLLGNAYAYHSSYDGDTLNVASSTKVSSIIGCGKKTVGQFGLYDEYPSGIYYDITTVDGDGTVPTISANLPGADQKFFVSYAVTGADHAGLVTKYAPLRVISDLVTGRAVGQQAGVGSSVVCLDQATAASYKISTHSPVTLHVYDSLNRHTGPLPDGSIETAIPDSIYEVLDGHSFIFVPEGGQYRIETKATDVGSFDMRIETLEGNQTIERTTYINVPLATSSAASETLFAGTAQPLDLDPEGDGLDPITVEPTATLTAEEAADVEPPTISIDPIPQDLMAGDSWTPQFSAADDDSGVLQTLGYLDETSVVSGTPITLLAEGLHELKVETIDLAGNPRTVSVSFSVAAPPPTITIDTAPETFVNIAEAAIVFHASSQDAIVECRIDGGEWATCASPVEYEELSVGSHTVVIHAKNPAGNFGEAASATWSIDMTLPEIAIAVPASDLLTNQAVIDITGAVSDAASGIASVMVEEIECAVEAGEFTCADVPLVEGVNTLTVLATDAAGNDASDMVNVTRDSTAPDTVIDLGPSGTVTSNSASITFHSTESGNTFECKLDTGAWETCDSPKEYSALTDGDHTFSVRATDAATNIDATPAAATWIIDTAAPDTVIDLAPSGTVATSSASIIFHSTELNSTFQCQLDGTGWADCTSPKAYTTLAEGPHDFLVKATDAVGNNDATEATASWVIDTTAPDTVIDTNPADPTNSTGASFAFHSTESGGTFECQLDGGSWGACTSPKNYSDLSSESHTFNVRATDAIGNVDAVPATYTWTIDTVAPNTLIDTNPTNPSNSSAPSFTFHSTESGSTFECKLDSGSWESCISPKAYSGAGDGSHTFNARATDAAGNLDASLVTYTWTIDATAPNTIIDTNPPAATTSTSASFTFHSTEAGSTLQCQLDGGSWSTCTSPKNYSSLSSASHTFNVRATDGASNVDATPGTYTWTVDTTPPNTLIDTTPPNPSNSTSPSFTFHSTEAGSTFQCKMDSGSWSTCTSPKNYSGLSSASHTFNVRATDTPGNLDASPATYAWTIDTSAPNTIIDSNPPNNTSSTTATFTFHSSQTPSTFECQLDTGSWSSCTTPKTYTGMTVGSHTFRVRARDAAGNVDASPATDSWNVN